MEIENRGYVINKTMEIKTEFESFAKVTCDHMSCVNRREGSLFCNLKNIEIDSNGKCRNLDIVDILKEKKD